MFRRPSQTKTPVPTSVPVPTTPSTLYLRPLQVTAAVNKSTAQVLVSVALPPLGSDAVDVRVLIRPAKVYKELLQADREVSAQLAAAFRKQAEQQFKDARTNHTVTAQEFHERMMENQRGMGPLREKQAQIFADYAATARNLLPPPPDSSADSQPLDGWLVVDGDSGRYVPLDRELQAATDKFVTLKDARERCAVGDSA